MNISNNYCQIFYDFRYGIPSNSAINKSLKRLFEKRSIQSRMTATGARDTYEHVLTEVIDKEYETVRSLVS